MRDIDQNELTPDDADAEFPELERYELHEGPAYRFQPHRREFIQVLGAGLLIALAPRPATAQRPRRGGGRGRGGGGPENLSARLHVSEDGVVTVLSSKVEVGQGSRTQIAQAAAEELQLPLERIRVLLADTGLCPDDGGTAGSRTTPATVPRVRQAAAAARELLVDLAAKRLDADRSRLRIQEGRFVDADSDRGITLSELAGGEEVASALNVPVRDGISLTRVDQWRVLGTAASHVKGEDVVTGAHQYPSDIVRPRMLYGRVLRPPALNGRLTSIDPAAARSIDGVTFVQDGSFVGCVARTSWLASRAIAALQRTAEWDIPQQPSSEEVFEHFKRHADARGGRGRANEWGDREPAFRRAATKIDVGYTVAYIQHAPMEPRAAVAEWNDGRLTVWTGTQQPARVRGELAAAFRIPDSRVRVIVPDTGGGFGGKHTGEAAVEAARLARAAGRPVSLRWTREEECTWAYCRPAGLIEVQAGLDEARRLLVWDFANYNSGGSAIDTPYHVPHGRTRFLPTDSPLRQGSYRALASAANTFARESAMDELADAAGADPLEFRLAHLPDGRLKDVLKAAAERFDWARKSRQQGNANGHGPRGVGLACGTEKGSYTAACVEVEIRNGEIKVLSVCQAYECGAIQNPANLRSQVDGCIIMGLGGALTEEVRFENGRILNPGFSSYQVPRMGDVPELDIVLLNRSDLASVGAGETPIIAVAPAIGNAVFHAAGARLRSLPMRLG